jgi:uncharacterized protein involved in type VI secretion and phage assembly
MEANPIAQLHDWISDRRFGKYRGKVVDNNDPTHRGRIRVRVDAIAGIEAFWAMPCVPYAGKNVGLFAVPPNETMVWIEFEQGDTTQPIWVGCFWADKEAPEGGDITRKVWKTDAITVVLDDKADQVHVENSSQASLTMTTKIVSQAATSKHTVAAPSVVSEAASGKLEVSAAGVVLNNGSFAVS